MTLNESTASLWGADAPEGRRLALLEGITVLDLTRFLAGPFGSLVLADLGARVVKVEQLDGDSTRYTPPHRVGDDSAYFVGINRNKESIAINLRSREGRLILTRLIRQSDVILDNLRAPQRRALGLDFDSLSQVKPDIISCSVTGFGSDGPYADRPAYDIIVEAIAGVMSLTGPETGPSVRAGVPIGDITAGMYAAIGALAGLVHRENTGAGVHIDVSMLDSQVTLLSYLAQYFFASGVVPGRQGRGHESIPTYNAFPTKDDSELVIAANTDDMWASLCKVLGREELPSDPRFANRESRLANREALIEILEGEFSLRDRDELLYSLIEHSVPAAPINSMDQALRDPQVRHREMVVRIRHRSGMDIPTLGTAIKASGGVEGERFLSPPGLGEHSRTILTELGYESAEIDTLHDSGIVRVSGVDG